MWDAIWDDEIIDRDDEIEWEIIDTENDDDDADTDGDEIETVSLDEWLAEMS
jgi:hypothetical protein